MRWVAAVGLVACGQSDPDPGDSDIVPTATEDPTVNDSWRGVSVGFHYGCGLLQTGVADCWGYPPGGLDGLPVASLDAGDYHACVIEDTGLLRCFGENVNGQLGVPTGAYAFVVAGASLACALDAAGTATCWGDELTPFEDSARNVPDDGPWTDLAAARAVCGILERDSSVRCWGALDQVNDEVPPGAYQDIAVTTNHACALDLQGEVTCWGIDENEGEDDYVPIPAGPFESLADAEHAVCGLRADGMIDCFLYPSPGLRDTPQPEPMGAVDVGLTFGCGIGYSGALTCWGEDDAGGGVGPE